MKTTIAGKVEKRKQTAALMLGCLFFVCLLRCPINAQDRVNINTASVEELQQLPGVGPSLASRIVAHRRRHGAFKRPQDIIIIHRFSPKLYRQIAHLIRI